MISKSLVRSHFWAESSRVEWRWKCILYKVARQNLLQVAIIIFCAFVDIDVLEHQKINQTSQDEKPRPSTWWPKAKDTLIFIEPRIDYCHHTMSSLSLLVRRAGLLTSKRAGRLSSTALKATFSTQPKLKNKNEKVTFRHDFYGDENPEMREFFDSMEEAIKKSLHLVKDKESAEKLQNIYLDAKDVYAVDAPDGVSDGSVKEEMQQINMLFDNVSQRTNEVQARLQKLTGMMREAYAVDSPDGEVDGHIKEEMEEVKRIIDDSSKVEHKNDMDAIKEALRKKRASDPEHW